MIQIREVTAADGTWVRESLEREWESAIAVSRTRIHHPDRLPGLIAVRSGERVGLLKYMIEDGQLEVVTIQSLVRRLGIGTALLSAARDLAKARGCSRLWVVTTNENAAAISLYSRFGMKHVATYRGAMKEARRLKPQIPEYGPDGTPIEDELEFELRFELGETDSVLALDAMGVIYEAADDVAELLIPFVRQHGGTRDAVRIEQLYTEASLGKLTAAEFWRSVGVDPQLEDEYLAGHHLRAGLLPFLAEVHGKVTGVFCLSNDVSEWSVKLRRRFRLEQWISRWFISGDLGYRKPSPELFQSVLHQTGLSADRIVFVDDRPRNVSAAIAAGLRGLLFDPARQCAESDLPTVRSFSEIYAQEGGRWRMSGSR